MSSHVKSYRRHVTCHVASACDISPYIEWHTSCIMRNAHATRYNVTLDHIINMIWCMHTLGRHKIYAPPPSKFHHQVLSSIIQEKSGEFGSNKFATGGSGTSRIALDVRCACGGGERGGCRAAGSACGARRARAGSRAAAGPCADHGCARRRGPDFASGTRRVVFCDSTNRSYAHRMPPAPFVRGISHPSRARWSYGRAAAAPCTYGRGWSLSQDHWITATRDQYQYLC